VDTIAPVAVRLVPVAAPITGVVNTIEVLVQFDRLPLVGVPNTGVVNAIEVLVQALMLPLATVPSAGVTSVGLVNRLVMDSCLVVLVVAWTIGNTSAPACEAATGRAEIAILAMLVIPTINIEPLASRHDGIRQAHNVVGVVNAFDVALAGHCKPLHLGRWLNAKLSGDLAR